MNSVQLHFFADEIYQLEKEAGGLTAVASGVSRLLPGGSKVVRGANTLAKTEQASTMQAIIKQLRGLEKGTPAHTDALKRLSTAHSEHIRLKKLTPGPRVQFRPDGRVLPPPPMTKTPTQKRLARLAKQSGQTTATVQSGVDATNRAALKAVTANPATFNATMAMTRTMHNPQTLMASGVTELGGQLAASGIGGALKGVGRRRAGTALDVFGDIASAAA